MATNDPDRPLWDRHLWQIRPVRDVLLIAVVVGLLWLGYALRDITVPLLVALLLAYLCEPMVAAMARAKWIPFGRTGAVSVLLIGLSIGVLAGAALVVPKVVGQTVTLVKSVEDGTARTKAEAIAADYLPATVQQEAAWFIDHLPDGSDADTTTEVPAPDTAAMAAQLRDQTGDLDMWGLAGRTGKLVMSAINTVMSVGLLVFLIPFYFFFFSVSYPRVAAFMDSMIPETVQPTVMPLLTKFDRAVAGFVRGRLLIAAMLGVVFFVGWSIAGVPYAFVLSLVTAALCLVPFVSGLILPLAIGLLAMAQLDLPVDDRMAWWGIILWPSLVFTIAQLLDGWVLQPIILGRTTDLDPVTIFVAVLAGGAVLGMYGMLIAIPVAACVKIALVDVVIPKVREMGRA
ncbi:MAG: AI-2E family transporter [Phycisphaerales bacterium]|nr:AI-2E family transporter [Phycisphaerales bacterium]